MLLSSTESEYRSPALTAAELFWICMVTRDLGIFLKISPLIYCDIVSAIALASNLAYHTHSKHVEVDYYFIRD